MRHSVVGGSLMQMKQHGFVVLAIACASAMLAAGQTSGQTSGHATTGSGLGSNFFRPQRSDGSEFVTHPVEAHPMAPRAINHATSPPPSLPPARADVTALPTSTADSVTPPPAATSRDLLPLRPPSESTGLASSDRAQTNLAVVVKALALVLGLFFGALWVARRGGWKPRSATESSLFHVLGEFPLASRRKATIVKFGARLLVLADSPRGVEKITEITDPAEVEQVMTMCQPQFGGQRVSTIQDWMRQRGLHSGITTDIPGHPG